MTHPYPHDPYGQPPVSPGYQPYPPVVNVSPTAPDASRKFLNLSGAALIWVIIIGLLTCVGGPIVVCVLCGLGGLLSGGGTPADPSPGAF